MAILGERANRSIRPECTVASGGKCIVHTRYVDSVPTAFFTQMRKEKSASQPDGCSRLSRRHGA
jgi:hypothetical protein